MFSGIVAALGRITRVQPHADNMRIEIASGALPLQDAAIGDSIAVNGVCLTLVEKGERRCAFDVSRETLACSAGLEQAGAEVNLELALRLADRIGGHLVTGHVDGVGTVSAVQAEGEHVRMRIRIPPVLARLVARKGSIAVNGVSLTVNDVAGDEFGVNLIPHTLAMTNLKGLAVGSGVNLEVDMIARYVERMLASIDRSAE
jgi:riboflavin synthase